MNEILPDSLKTGDVIVSKKTRATIQRTTQRDEYGCVLYRLRFSNGLLGASRYSRDQLQELGCRLAETSSKEKS